VLVLVEPDQPEHGQQFRVQLAVLSADRTRAHRQRIEHASPPQPRRGQRAKLAEQAIAGHLKPFGGGAFF
jgi:hypothetical protein